MPTPDVVLGPFNTTAGGTFTIGGPWLLGAPAGFEMNFQFWVGDPGAPFGFSGSNGLSAITP